MTVELEQLRRDKKQAKLRVKEIDEKMRIRKARQSEMMSREIDTLKEWDRAEQVISEAAISDAPVTVPVSESLSFDFFDYESQGFEDGSWEQSLVGLVSGGIEQVAPSSRSS